MKLILLNSLGMTVSVMSGLLAVFCGTCPITKTGLFMSASSLQYQQTEVTYPYFQQLGTSLGYSVAQDTADNTSALEISRFIDEDIPVV